MLTKSGFGSSSSRGFGYKPRNYGLASGLQSAASKRPAYYGAGINGGLLNDYGSANGSLGVVSELGQTVPRVAPATSSMRTMMRTPEVGTAPGAAQAAPAAQTSGSVVPSGWVDPTLGRIMAFNSRNREMARSQAAAARKQLAIDYGDASISGDLAGDESTSKAARENPFSVLALLRKHYEQDAPRDLDENYNRSNLFFSGARAKGLGDLSTEYQQQQATSDREARSALSEIDSGLLEALMAADYADMNAQWNQPYPEGGSAGGGNDVGGPAASPNVNASGNDISVGSDVWDRGEPARPSSVGPDWIWEPEMGPRGGWTRPDGGQIVLA